MPSGKRVWNATSVRHAGDGLKIGAPVTTPTLYLDTSDLSYLMLGDVIKGDGRAVPWRERLLELLKSHRVRLRVSLIHAAEVLLRPDLIEIAARLLNDTPNIVFVETTPHSIFRQELQHAGREPTVLMEKRASSAEFEHPLFQLPLIGLRLSPACLSALVKLLLKLRARGRALEREQRRSPRSLKFSDWLASREAVRTLLRRRGLPDGFLDPDGPWDAAGGLSWTATMQPRFFPRRLNNGWEPEDILAMPATVLRATIARRDYADRGRPLRSSSLYDVEHMAYVAYSDYSTMDAANFDATKAVHKHLPHLRIFKCGNLEPVLELIERQLTEAP